MGRYDDQNVSLDSKNKRRFYQALLDFTIEKSIDDLYIIASYGERLDSLAWKYYGDVQYWWIIAAANPELRRDSMFLDPGVQVRVPTNYIDIEQQYQEFNNL
jgi:hypothetical protein